MLISGYALEDPFKGMTIAPQAAFLEWNVHVCRIHNHKLKNLFFLPVRGNSHHNRLGSRYANFKHKVIKEFYRIDDRDNLSWVGEELDLGVAFATLLGTCVKDVKRCMRLHDNFSVLFA